jgi:hypothetical protein
MGLLKEFLGTAAVIAVLGAAYSQIKPYTIKDTIIRDIVKSDTSIQLYFGRDSSRTDRAEFRYYGMDDLAKSSMDKIGIGDTIDLEFKDNIFSGYYTRAYNLRKHN